ncbi:D-alanyl-D-alanine carboxypeptidase/D-alanyl-D-alanine-endopeptidase [soil metagenome]
MSVGRGLMWAVVLAAIFLIGGPGSAAPQAVSNALDGVADHGDVSVVVAARGRTLYEHAGDERRTPASAQKVLLSMALFDEFGPAHRIKTRVFSTESGEAVGTLWIVGGGDPSMVSGWGDATHTGVRRLAKRIQRAGVTRVRGSVVVESSLFASDWHAPGWQPWSRDFANRATALTVDGNGSPDPPLAFGASLTDALETRGIEVGRQPRSGSAPTRARVVTRVRSASLRTLVTHMNVSSSNFYAEMFGKLLGARTFQTPGTMSRGARAIEEFAADHGVDLIAHDSSGLSYANRVSANGIVTLLEDARRQPWGRALRLSLPSPGRGTLGSRLEGLGVRAKTGTLWNGTSALAGWVRLRHGGTAEFAVLSRNSSKSTEDAIVQRVAAELKAPEERADAQPRVDTGCHLGDWWKEIWPRARTPQ